MKRKKADKKATGSMGQFLVVLRGTNFPWVWMILTFLANMGTNYLMLRLPGMTAGMVNGELSSEAMMERLMFYVYCALLFCTQSTLQAIARPLAARNAREKVWGRMMNIRVDYYDQNDPAKLMSAVSNDLGFAMPALLSLMTTVLPDIWYIISALTQISTYNIILTLTLVVFVPVKYFYLMIIGRRFYQTRLGIFQQIGGLTGYLAERISCLPLIKAFTREEYEQERGTEAAKSLYQANMQQNKLYAVDKVIDTCITLGEQILVMVTAVILLQKKMITGTQWLEFFLFYETIRSVFDKIAYNWMQVKDVQGSVARTADLLTVPQEKLGAESGGQTVSGGDIEFDRVSFSYGDKAALTDVSFTVPKGTMTAIVGLCGSGKTTSLSLLERFYAPKEGQIRLGGTPVGEMPLGEYRKHFAYVQQNPEVFSGTIREALTYGIPREISDEELLRAARDTGFAEYLELQPEGLDAAVAPGGSSMSGGQRQRLVLAREFLRGAEVLLLDEPTSALDAESTAMVHQTIFTLFKGRTVLMVTHDMDLLRGMDQIVVLQESRLMGCGTYEELMRSCDLFREMIETQEKEQEVTA